MGGGGPGGEEAGGGRAVLVPWDFTGYQSIRLTLIILTINMFFLVPRLLCLSALLNFQRTKIK